MLFLDFVYLGLVEEPLVILNFIGSPRVGHTKSNDFTDVSIFISLQFRPLVWSCPGEVQVMLSLLSPVMPDFIPLTCLPVLFFHMGFDPSSSLSGFLGHFSKFLFMFFLFFLSHLSLYLSTHFHRFTSLSISNVEGFVQFCKIFIDVNCLQPSSIGS